MQDSEPSSPLSAKKEPLLKDKDPGEHWLFKLIRNGFYEQVEEQLREDDGMPDGLPIDAREKKFGWGLLHFAAHSGENGLVEWLLKKKAKHDQVDYEGSTPLVLCAKQNNVKGLELLLARGASITVKSKDFEFTPLIWAATAGHQEAIETLVQVSANLKAKDAEGRTAMMWAARHGHLPVVQIFLRLNCDLTLRDKEGLTALDHCREHLELRAAVVLAQELCNRMLDAAQRNDFKVVGHVLKGGAMPFYKDASGWSPMTWAMLHDSAELARVLVRHGASPELLGEDADVCNQIAHKGHCIGEKLAAVLSSNQQMLDAAEENDTEGVRLALEAGACPDARQGKDGGGGGQGSRVGGRVTAADREDEMMFGAELATEVGAEPDGEGFGRNMTATMWAARRGNVEMVEILGTGGANMNLRDSRGWTAMLFAMFRGDAETVSTLVHFQADINIKGFEGESAMHLAVRLNDAVSVQLLLAADADIQEQDLAGQSPLHAAAQRGSIEALRVLAFFGADFAAKDKRGRTPFIVGACSGWPAVCQEMVATEIKELPELPIEIPPSEVPVEEEEELEVPEQVVEEQQPGDEESIETGSATQDEGSSRRASSKKKTPASSEQGDAEASKSPKKPASDSAGSKDAQSRASSKSGHKSSRESKQRGEEKGKRKDSKEKGKAQESKNKKVGKLRGKLEDARQKAGLYNVVDAMAEGDEEEAEQDSKVADKDEEPSPPPLPEEPPKPEEKPRIGLELLMKAAVLRKEKLLEPRPLPGRKILSDIGGKNKRAALHFNIVMGERNCHFNTLVTLLELQANCNTADASGTTPLMLAAAKNYSQAVERMLAQPETIPDLKDSKERTAADMATNIELRRILESAMVEKAAKGRKMQEERAAEAARQAKEKAEAAEREANKGKKDKKGKAPESKPAATRSPTPEPPRPKEEFTVFRVRLEKLPQKADPEELEQTIRKLMKRAVVRPVHYQVVIDPIYSRPKGHAYVDFLDERMATKALELDGQDAGGFTVRVYRDLPALMVR